MGLFLKKRVEMPDKMILGNTEFVIDRKLGFHVGEWTIWDRKTKILLEFQSTEGNIGDIVLEKVNWVNDHKDTIIRAFLDENDAVSYTHLDVYKRQAPFSPVMSMITPLVSLGRSAITPTRSRMKPICSSPLMRATIRPRCV